MNTFLRKLLVGLCLTFPAYADNYYDFGGNDNLIGTFTTSYGDPLTVFAWIKFTVHPISFEYIITLGNSSSSQNDSYSCRTHNVDNVFAAISQDSAGVTNAATATKTGVDGVWVPVICEFIGTTSRAMFAADATGTNSSSRTVADAVNDIRLGETFAAGSDFHGGIAYPAAWDRQLTDPEEASLLGGTCPASVGSSDLIAYWPLQASNATQQNEGVDAGGDLAVTGATFVSGGGPGISCGASAPTYTAGPTLGTMTSTTAPTTFTSDQTGTAEGVACPDGQTLPTVTQVLADNCTGNVAAVSSWDEAVVAGVSDAHTFTGLSASTVYDLSFAQTGTGGNSAAISTIANATTTGAGTPIFDSGPSVSSQTAAAYTIAYDASAGATNINCGAYLKDATAPTAAQLAAGTNAHGTATEATTGSADSIVLTPSESDKFPIYDLYCVVKNATPVYSGLGIMIDEMLDAPTDRQFVTKSGAPTGSEEGILDDASPAAVNGDIMDAPLATDSFEQGDAVHALTLNTDTTFVIAVAGDDSRQVFTRRFYDVSLAAWSEAAAVAYYVNNDAPIFITPGGDEPFLFEKNVTNAYVLDEVWFDNEDDALTHTVTNMPAGGTLTGSETITGAFTTLGRYPTVSLKATDITTDFTSQTVEFVVGARVPDVISWLLEDKWETDSLFASTGSLKELRYVSR